MFQLLVNKKTIWNMAASFTLLFAVLPVRASDWLPGHDTSWGNTMQQSEMQQSKMDKMAGRADYLQNAKTLLNADIKNNTGETLGKVRELILNDNRDSVLYVVLESNGTFHPVPWAAFDVAPASIVLDVEKIEFMNSPQTGSNYLEKLNSADFRKEIRSFYSERIDAAMKAAHLEEAIAPAMEKPVLRTYSSVIGLKVENIQGENLASVRSLIIDTRHGTIPYALVGFGGLFGIAEKTAAVPLTSLAIQPSENVAYLDADKATLETAVVDEANPVKLTEPQFTRSIAETFGAKPYWEVLGFVPSGEKAVSLDAWQQDSAYNRLFNPENVKTIDGTIQSIGIFTPEWGATAGLKLIVAVGENESLVIHGGPEQYAMQRKMDFKVGSPIAVTGSETKIGDETVIMASEIKVGDKTLTLRDDMGTPIWNIEEMKHEKENSQNSETFQERQYLEQ